MMNLTRSDLELNADQLRKTCDANLLLFKDTSELASLDNIIGQDRAIKALELGLDIPYYGYNIFLCGPAGTGKNTLAREMARKKRAPVRYRTTGVTFTILRIPTVRRLSAHLEAWVRSWSGI